MTDKEKLSEYLENKGISKKKFYEQTKFSNGWLKSGHSFSVESLRVILEKYPDFPIKEFLYGDKNLIEENSNLDQVKEVRSDYSRLSKCYEDLIEEKDKRLEDNRKLIERSDELINILKAQVEDLENRLKDSKSPKSVVEKDH